MITDYPHDSGRSPFFSVVIPTYNRAEKLKETLSSVLVQTFSDFEVLVMDDGSTDNTESVVNGFSDSRVKYEWASNSGGPATPRNRGIIAASAPWVCFLDADDIWYPTKLAEVAEAIDQQPEVDAFCHNEMLYTKKDDSKSLISYGPYEGDFYQVLLFRGNRLSTSAMTVRREFIEEHKIRFNQSSDYVIVEDFDFWLHLAHYGAHFSFISKPLGEYVIEDDNISHAVKKARYNERILLKDHIYKIQQFEPDRDKLWKQVRFRFEFDKSRELMVNSDLLRGAGQLVSSIFRHPLQTIWLLGYKLRDKWNRAG